MATWWEQRTARVGTAVAIVSAQAHCSEREALALLRKSAEGTGRDLEDAALAVVARRTSFATPIRATEDSTRSVHCACVKHAGVS